MSLDSVLIHPSCSDFCRTYGFQKDFFFLHAWFMPLGWEKETLGQHETITHVIRDPKKRIRLKFYILLNRNNNNIFGSFEIFDVDDIDVLPHNLPLPLPNELLLPFQRFDSLPLFNISAFVLPQFNDQLFFACLICKPDDIPTQHLNLSLRFRFNQHTIFSNRETHIHALWTCIFFNLTVLHLDANHIIGQTLDVSCSFNYDQIKKFGSCTILPKQQTPTSWDQIFPNPPAHCSLPKFSYIF